MLLPGCQQALNPVEEGKEKKDKEKRDEEEGCRGEETLMESIIV